MGKERWEWNERLRDWRLSPELRFGEMGEGLRMAYR